MKLFIRFRHYVASFLIPNYFIKDFAATQYDFQQHSCESRNRSLIFQILFFSILCMFGFQACLEEPQTQNPDPPEINKFIILPANPVSKDEVNMVTYDCKYHVLASVTSRGKDITVKKRFNSQMKWPCILYYDTIPLGRLTQGTYKITMLIVDTNPMVKDSISVQQTLDLEVGK